jgi:CheY-like chemotaxis protein
MTERGTDENKYVTFQEAERLRALVQAADEALGRIGLVVRELERQTGSALGHIQAVTLNQALAAARPSIERLMARGRRTRFFFDCEVPIVGDAAQLSRVIVDLVDNALESIDDNGLVEVHCTAYDSFVELLVDDDGPGVEPEMRDRVFEPLFTTRQSRGALGMGLARASAVVERHGGALTVERSPLGGARFAVRIPLQMGDMPRSSMRSLPLSSGVQSPRARILIVDDEPAIRDSYRRVLRSHYEVDVADSSEAAMKLIQDARYDVILCDVIMPGDDGVSLAKLLADKHPEQARGLMFCTGGVLEPTQERFLSGWSNGYLRKPLSAQELTDCLESFLKERVELTAMD